MAESRVESTVESRFPPHTNPSGRQTLFAGTHTLFWWQPAKSFEKGFDGDAVALIIFFMIESSCRIGPEPRQTDSPATVGLSGYRKCAPFHSETRQSEAPNSNRSIEYATLARLGE